MTERKIGPFVLGKQIGAGGMGVVYQATYVETGKEVALKVLPPGLVGDAKLLKRFEREIDILKRLTHPNIVRYYGGGTNNGQRWYAMELIDGGSLYDILRKKRRLSWDQTIQVGRQLCAALERAHNAGIIHRDLKPANLFVTKKGKIKLGDFGIARDTEATALTAVGKTVGTYAYMAPEQIQGNVAISRKTDLYAAGCLLYEVLTGETPFVADHPAEMLMMHLNDAPYHVREKIPECPLALDALIDRLLEKNPDDRPYDALAVHTELTEILKKAQEVVSEVSPQALASSGTSAADLIDPKTGEVRPKKKKKKDKSRFYEKTWFLVTCLSLLIAFGIWLALGPSEDALYLQAQAFMKDCETVAQFDDAKRLFLQPYLTQFPSGKHVADVTGWLDDVEVAILQSQVDNKAKFQRDGRNTWESLCLKAVVAERDEERNPLEAIELFQSMVDTLTDAAPIASEPAAGTETPDFTTETDAAANPRYWKLLAEQHRNALKQTLLSHPERERLITERMTAAEQKLNSDKRNEGVAVFRLFREVFRADRDVEAWFEYAGRRARGESAKMPNAE